jgi:hypothetical protein
VIALSEWWTVGADLRVALGTALLAFFTWRVATRTGALADETHLLGAETRTLASETSEDVRSGVRPALIDAARHAEPQMEFGGKVLVDEQEIKKSFGTLKVNVRNAGRGPALNVYAYAFVATSAFDLRTFTSIIGNIAPEESTTVQLFDVPNLDPSDDGDPYLAIRVVLVYSDLGGRQYHTVIRLSDPGEGRYRSGEPSWLSLTQEGTEVGDGEAPPPQWVVSFYGHTTPEQDVRLRANAMQVMRHGGSTSSSFEEGPGEPSAWGYDVYVSAYGSDAAIQRVKDALGEGAFGKWKAELWTAEPFTPPPEKPTP